QALTAEGSIVGTFQYMSPEQLEGNEADPRADLWALGCVLYEMSTGRRAFEGRSQASLISAIMSSEPAAVSQVALTSPPALDRLIAACLAKDPSDRVQSAHDVRLQLQWMSEPGSHSAPALLGAAATPRARNSALLTRVALAVGVLGLLAAAYMGYAQSTRKSPVMRLQIPMPSDLTLAPFWSFSAISPDGAHVVATGDRARDGQTLWLWALDSTNPIELTGAANGYSPTWSPDGRALAYFSSAGASLYRLSLAGGNPTKLCAAPVARGASWGRKDILVFAPSASGPLYQVAARGGSPSPVTALDSSRGESSHRFPCFLPDGEHFLFATLPEGPRGFPIFMGSLGSKKVKHIMDAGCAPIYAEPGYLVFVEGGNVTAQRFDLNRLELVGEPTAIGDAPAPSEYTAEPVATASRNDRLLIQRLTSPRSKLEWLDRKGSSLSTIALPEGDWLVRALSPDQTFAIATRDRDIWRVDLERAVPTRVVRDAWNEVGVALSPDGRRLAVDLGKSGGLTVDIYNAGGSGAAEKLKTAPALFQDVMDWSPDGTSLLLAVLGQKANQGGDTSWDLWTVPVTEGGTPAPYVSTSALERYARISPDGKWAMFMTVDNGQLEIFVDSYPVPGHRLQVLPGEPDRVCRILWGRDSREVLYSDRHGDLISLSLEPVGDDLRAGTPTRMFALPEDMTSIRTRDGERFLVSRPSGSTPGPSLQLTLGWTGLLRK
ncbi:MAG: protein kinase, partial [Candidatus Eisenbacteria bacterium]